MSEARSNGAASPPSPLATPEPWDLVRDGYVEELWGHFSRFAGDALALVPLTADSEVLDVATGPGTLALQAAPRVRRVVGVDFSPRMLEEFGRRAAAQNATNVEAIEGNGQALPLPDSAFDFAFSMFGVIFFPDRARGLAELLRVLKPRGRAVVSSWRPFDLVPPLQAVFQALHEQMPDVPFGKSKAPLSEPEEFLAELRSAGFADVAVHSVAHPVVAASPEAFWRSVERSTAPLVLLRAKIGEARWGAISEAVLARLTERFGPGQVEMQFHALLGVGTRD